MPTPVEAFFAEFERLTATSDPEALAALYAPTFLAGGAAGTHVIHAADLAAAIPKRKQMLESAGCSDAALASLEETALDDRFTLARATWRWSCTRAGEPPLDITVASTYVVERTGDRLQIVVYLAHGDIVSILRARGVLA